jgi:hypothetical protein
MDMKFLLSVLIAAMPVLSFAAEREIFDLMYLPKAGTTFGMTNASYGSLETEVPGSKTETNIYGLQQMVGHTVTDNLLISADIQYQQFETNNDETTGFTDPRLGLRYRMLDETTRFDVLANFSYDTGRRNPIRPGNHEFNLGGQFGQKHQDFQWAFTLLFGRNFAPNNNEQTGVEGFFQYRAQFDGLYRVMNNGFIRGYAGAHLLESQVGRANVEVEPSETRFQAGAEFRYTLLNNLLLMAGVEYQKHQNAQIDGRNALILTTGALYQF